MVLQTKLTREEWNWSLYDVANSSFTLLLSTVIPIYVKNLGSAAGLSDATTTSQWALLQSFSTLIIALMAPALGAMADLRGRKKKLFGAFFALGVVMAFVMAFASTYQALLLIILLALVGYAGANVFYDAFLVDVTTDERMDMVSSVGFAAGYIGSCVPFVFSLLLINFLPFGLDMVGAVKYSFVINAVWWFLFTLPMLRTVHQKYGVDAKPGSRPIRDAFAKNLTTLKSIWKTPSLRYFLLAYFFYIDGVDTIIRMSTSFGKDVGIDDTNLLLALLLTQVVAFPAVLIFSKLTKRYSAKKIILFSIAFYTGICAFGFFLQHAWQFWLLAICVALVQGTIQALSRSYFGKLIPNKDEANEYFGFYNIFGKYAAVFGPILLAVFTMLTGSSRYGVLSVATLFILGFLLFRKVPDIGLVK